MRTTIALAGSAALIAIAAHAQPAPPADKEPATAEASFIDLQNKVIGSATLMETPHGVIIRAEIEGLEPGERSMHIHAVGKCDPATKFESAGPHFNPTGAEHGFMADKGPHGGDMPNQFVAGDGKLSVNLVNPMVVIGAADVANEKKNSLIDADGSAIVIHAGADDYRSQPAGKAGDRIACAVIQPAPK